ncbi:MAG TPA: PAS domain S-box protein [Lacunisphaera sp.]|nr:PAS domain S-box protein [Lacunisphaera sp.]
MNRSPVSLRTARGASAALFAGLWLAFAPAQALAADGSARQVDWVLEVSLVAGAFLAAGVTAWSIHRRNRKLLEQHTERRIREMTALIEHADGLLWEAEVELGPNDWLWRMTLHNSAFCRKLFNGYVPKPGVDLWEQFRIDDRAEMDRRCRAALEKGESGYVHEFRGVRDGQGYWLHENVSIRPLGKNRYWLVGLVTDITAQREAEAARRQSELTVDRILAHAQCLLWRATVVLQDGVLHWPHFDIPRSQFSELLFGDRIFSASRGFWDTLNIPEQAEMNDRSTKAILGDAPGYVQQFRAINSSGRVFWLHERVSITRVTEATWSLVGVVTDITAQHEAEEERRQSETRLSLLLERADTMIWQAQVQGRPDGTLAWTMYIPQSQLYRRIFFAEPIGQAGFAWEEHGVPEHVEMAHRAYHSITSGVPAYEQVFHVPGPTGDIWLREKTTIVASGPKQWDLVGIISDITAQRLAEDAQRESELQLSALLEQADCMIWQGEVRRSHAERYDWKIFTPNSQLYRRLFGREPVGDSGFAWTPETVPEFTEMTLRWKQALATGQGGYEQVFHYRMPSGDIWLNETVSIKSLGPDRWELVGIITDITAQHAAEAARATSEARLQELLSRADCLLWEARVRLNEWKWENRMQPSALSQRLFGDIQAEGDQVKLWREFNVPERVEMDERCRLAMREGRGGYEQVFRIIRSDDSVIWISESVTIREIGQGEYSLVGVAVDITPVRGAEEALAAEKERLAVTLRAMNECVITTDVTGLIQYMNPAAAILTGWRADEVQGREVGEICRLESSRTEQPVEMPISLVARGDRVADLPAHTRLITRGGANRQIEGCCAPIHAADSKVVGTVIVFRDVTEQEQLEQELVRATRLESVGVLAGGIAHDFNNILTAVMGNLALAQLDIPPDSPAGASLRSAEKAALRARDLTQQLLTFAKGGEPVRAAVQLEAIVREMAAFALHGSHVKAHYDMAPNLWPADADKGQIGRVVQNLVINAVQAMPKGGTLRIMARNDPHDGLSHPSLTRGDYIQIAISDTGEGIKQEHLTRIFDPYFTTKQTGTGLGLAAVYSIVKKHNGHIEVESQLGQGTTFRIWLPALRQELAKLDSRTPWDKPALIKGRVLFMDDEQIIRDMAVSLLQRFGLNVDCAVDGDEAVRKYRGAMDRGMRYDLVIMDLTVPGGMGGLVALGHLRQIDPQVKAIVSSGYSSDPVLANYRAHGFAAVMAKPYEVDELSRVLREVLPQG